LDAVFRDLTRGDEKLDRGANWTAADADESDEDDTSSEGDDESDEEDEDEEDEVDAKSKGKS
jgi:hypothetical protein